MKMTIEETSRKTLRLAYYFMSSRINIKTIDVDIKVGNPDELTDEQKAQRIAPPITVTIKNPPKWLIEEMRDDQE